MLRITQKGDLSKVTKYLRRVQDTAKDINLDRFGMEGVAALSAATPVDSGETASSWYYEIENQNGDYTISFMNKHVHRGVNIAIILQTGHGTRNGGYVQGRDYINPALQPVFEKLADDAWKEVTET
jgi:hypothetical protein